MAHRHVAGSMKQQNKTHKARHRTKSELNTTNKGRIDAFKSNGAKKLELNRQQRRLQAVHNRQNKRDQVVAAKRSLGTTAAPPLLIAVVALHGDGSEAMLMANILNNAAGSNEVLTSFGEPHTVFSSRIKQRLTLVPCTRDVATSLAFARAANSVLLVRNVEEDADADAEEFQTALCAQGVPTVSHVLTGLRSMAVKRKNELRRMASKQALERFPETKVHAYEKESDGATLLWALANQKRRRVRWRELRSHVLCERFAHDAATNTLAVTGYIRGRSWNVNALVHIPGLGARQVSHLDAAAEPVPMSNAKRRIQEDDMQPVDGAQTLATAHPDFQHSLVAEAEVSPFEGEQTFPTAEEEAAAEAEAHRTPAQAATEKLFQRKVVKVPKGWSDYQAAWIIDDETLEDAPLEEEEEDENGPRQFTATGGDDDNDDAAADDLEDEDMDTGAADWDHYDQEMDLDAEMEDYKKWRSAAAEDAEFPDEVDTPRDMAASIRFSKYRGLQSFKYSKWDAREELPTDYARIFKFKDFNLTRRRVFRDLEFQEHEDEGTYATLYVRDVPESWVQQYGQAGVPLILWNLLEHEAKMTVVNFTLQVEEGIVPLKSKERLIFDTGVRQFAVNPIFSQHSTLDKHKFERFAQPGSVIVASAICPVSYPPLPALVYRQDANGSLTLVATGSVLSVNPDRLVIKRVRLSGHPFKINKRSATIRYMFFNPDDIAWFKPVEVVTKYGRRGHIKESLGTHGHMKCTFDRQIKADDTILMNLYKRVYPKWSYEDTAVAAGQVMIRPRSIEGMVM
ncbi:uncharacterized protein MONBRDRAFT_15285 [Monosiga brevicollis MX1]|uniref:Bms1-type G domain-containing protein n=1 Tax=Monosiga brevicollis TaxID=81824 RepID=A9UTR2_MONBE|nr:uncharacterized protein MONBRDRAFT_15285 [Monosiga brevicollis MX1]EDQ91294.1 predicted protein [Monosiga brevicollis MX1]|eukprot:XP_001743716.1 hypothetical protein [Monosiga brevicollis MX1]